MILITGGMGFLGSHLARELLDRDYRVVLMDVVDRGELIGDIRDKVTLVKGDISNPNNLFEVVKKHEIQAIVHYAALLSDVAEKNPSLAYKVNVEGLWNVFEAARIFDIDFVIFASSVAAYGPPLPYKVREDEFTVPHTLYGISKQLGEMLGLWYKRKYDLDFAAFRYGSVIGPGRRDGGASAYTTLIIQKPAQGEPYEVKVPESAEMPIVYVRDAVDATIAACERVKDLKSRIYNLASLKPSPTARDLVEEVKNQISDAGLTFKPDPGLTSIVKSWPREIDVTRARNELSWASRYSSLPSLVRDFIETVKGHPEIFRI